MNEETEIETQDEGEYENSLDFGDTITAEQGTVRELVPSAAIAVIEAILFASGEPLTLSRLAEALGITEERTAEYVTQLERRYNVSESGLRVVRLNKCYQIVTRIEYADYVKKALVIKRNAALSQAAIECLALIAYNQPTTKSFIEAVRGIDSGSVVNTLVEKGLIEECEERLPLPGRPIAYRTTEHFLLCFGLSSISALPPLVSPAEDNFENADADDDSEDSEVAVLQFAPDAEAG